MNTGVSVWADFTTRNTKEWFWKNGVMRSGLLEMGVDSSGAEVSGNVEVPVRRSRIPAKAGNLGFQGVPEDIPVARGL